MHRRSLLGNKQVALNNLFQDALSSSFDFFVFPPWVVWCSASIQHDATVLEILGKALPLALGKNCIGSKTDSAVYKLAAFLSELQKEQLNVCGSAYPSKMQRCLRLLSCYYGWCLWKGNVSSISPRVDFFLVAVESWLVPVLLGLPVSGCSF